MKYGKLSLLIVVVLVLAGLFYFSSWTNAMVVGGDDISGTLKSFRKTAPFLFGLLVVAGVGLLANLVSGRKA